MIRVYIDLERLRHVRYIVMLRRRDVLYVNRCGAVDGIGIIIP